jgi:hypothetical protein
MTEAATHQAPARSGLGTLGASRSKKRPDQRVNLGAAVTGSGAMEGAFATTVVVANAGPSRNVQSRGRRAPSTQNRW